MGKIYRDYRLAKRLKKSIWKITEILGKLETMMWLCILFLNMIYRMNFLQRLRSRRKIKFKLDQKELLNDGICVISLLTIDPHDGKILMMHYHLSCCLMAIRNWCAYCRCLSLCSTSVLDEEAFNRATCLSG